MVSEDSYETLGLVKDGLFKMRDRAGFERAMALFKDGEVIASFTPATEKAWRSLQANRFMWKVFELIAAETGHTKDEIHDWMCQKFLTYAVDVVDPQTGEVTTVKVTRGTSRLKTDEHARFLDEVLQWAGEFLGMELPSREAA